MIATRTNQKRRKRRRRQSLRFTPYAWAKLKYLRDCGPTEVGGFGISSDDDLLLIEDIVMVDQICTAVTVEFNDDSVADLFDDQVQQGRQPEQFARIWIHTHPGNCPRPSQTDEETFERCFGSTDWSVMFILAHQGACYGRLQCNVGPGTSTRLRRVISHSAEFPAADHEQWQWEYDKCVSVYDPFTWRRDPFMVESGVATDATPGVEHHAWTESEWVAS